MLLNHQQALVPYATAETIQMVPGASGYVFTNRERNSGDMGLAYSFFGTYHNNSKILDEKYEMTYSRNRRQVSFGMSDVGSYIDIYA